MKITRKWLNSVRSVGVAALASLALAGPAQAGLVSGSWDPVFGPALPNLSWQVRTNWLVPNGCSSAADGIYSTTTPLSPCESTIGDPVRLLSVWLRWFNTTTGDAGNFFQQTFPESAHTGWCESVFAASNPSCAINSVLFNQGSEPLTATQVRVASGQVVGMDTNITSFLTFGWPPEAGTHSYDLSFTTNGPVLECTTCVPPVFASTVGLDQFLITYTSNDTGSPKFTDANGNILGAVLDANGVYQGQRIPEPGALALALTALMGLGAARRRRR